MSPSEERPTRRSWRPRFSIRALAVVVTLACVYFGAWEATKRYGLGSWAIASRPWPVIGKLNSEVREEYSLMPFLIRREEMDSFAPKSMIAAATRYYIWCFGFELRIYDSSGLLGVEFKSSATQS